QSIFTGNPTFCGLPTFYTQKKQPAHVLHPKKTAYPRFTHKKSSLPTFYTQKKQPTRVLRPKKRPAHVLPTKEAALEIQSRLPQRVNYR
ncbi:MAG: hypothetical protein UHZ05_04250, partial [Acutalibacteraceae bacterium]|nr:hypothetical protein [Acutalibacteraceae bacterium]